MLSETSKNVHMIIIICNKSAILQSDVKRGESNHCNRCSGIEDNQGKNGGALYLWLCTNVHFEADNHQRKSMYIATY